MKPAVPITYHLNWRVVSNELVPTIMEQVASYGIENIVLTDYLMYHLCELDNHELYLKSAAAAGLKFVDQCSFCN